MFSDTLLKILGDYESKQSILNDRYNENVVARLEFTVTVLNRLTLTKFSNFKFNKLLLLSSGALKKLSSSCFGYIFWSKLGIIFGLNCDDACVA